MKLTIIGAGPGGYVAALYAAKRGVSVTLIEKAELGGVCLNRGCVPTKAILHSANALHMARSFASLGVRGGAQGVDYAQVITRRDEIVKRLRRGVAFLLNKAGVRVVRGEASLLGGTRVRVSSDGALTDIEADNLIIAAGATAANIPAAPVDGRVILNSDHLLALEELPESLTIIGGGVIGCEFAQAFARMGCRVTLVEALPRLAAVIDEAVSETLRAALAADGVEMHLNARVENASPSADGAIVRFTGADGAGREVSAQKALVAVGRKPNLAALGAERAGITCERGCIQVDDRMRTNVPGVYAIGDVTGGPQLAHAASYGGVTAVRHMLGEHVSMSAACVPMCIYTDPEIASVGMTAAAARKLGIECREGLFPLSANARALIEGGEHGFVKTVFDGENALIGAHLAGPNVTEMISYIGGLINVGAAAEDIEGMIFTHPSVSEGFAEGVAAAAGMAIHIP